jgi:hypothetical protein
MQAWAQRFVELKVTVVLSLAAYGLSKAGEHQRVHRLCNGKKGS